jgi:hypothetical protein
MDRPATAWAAVSEAALAVAEAQGDMEEALAGGGPMPLQEDGTDLLTLGLMGIRMPP